VRTQHLSSPEKTVLTRLWTDWFLNLECLASKTVRSKFLLINYSVSSIFL
jgi:hypothetical protein